MPTISSSSAAAAEPQFRLCRVGFAFNQTEIGNFGSVASGSCFVYVYDMDYSRSRVGFIKIPEP